MVIKINLEAEQYIKQGQLNAGASQGDILNVNKAFDYLLPKDYMEFICRHNGGYGFVGDSYLDLWRVEDLLVRHERKRVNEFTPGLILFGSDGGDEVFGFDCRQKIPVIVAIPAILDWNDARLMGALFIEFLAQLEKGIPPFDFA